MVKIGIIGAGNMGKLHASLIKKQERGYVTAVYDSDKERAIALAKQYQAISYSEIDDFLDSGISMVFITVPNTKHAQFASKALKRNLDVFVEKPLATNLKDAHELVKITRESGKKLFVGLNRRFAPIYVEAKNIIESTNFKPININIIQNDGDMRNPPWATDINLTGGFLYDTTVHFLDMAEYLIGPINEISAVSSKAFYPITDGFAILLKFSENDGRKRFGLISSCGYASWISPFERVQVVGDHRSVITEELDYIRHGLNESLIVEAKEFAKLPYEEKWGYSQMHKHIFDSLEFGFSAINNVEVGERTIELISACEKSAMSDGIFINV